MLELILVVVVIVCVAILSLGAAFRQGRAAEAARLQSRVLRGVRPQDVESKMMETYQQAWNRACEVCLYYGSADVRCVMSESGLVLMVGTIVVASWREVDGVEDFYADVDEQDIKALCSSAKQKRNVHIPVYVQQEPVYE